MLINTCFLFQEHLSVCAGWGVSGTFLSSLEMSVKYSSVVSLRDCQPTVIYLVSQAGSRGADVCSTAPCSHGGQCIQLKYGGYRCDCTGTGYYGQYCSKSKYPQNIDRGGAIF